MYDAQLGRWHVIDPLTETQESWSVYHYVYNNPIKNTDPDGREPEAAPPVGGGNPMYWVANGFGKMFEAAGSAVDKLNVKVQAFFSFGSEAEGSVGGVKGGVKGNNSNETRTTVTVGTTAKDFFTPTSDNKPVAASPFVVSVKTTNETKATISGKVNIRGIDIHAKNVTSRDNLTHEVSNTTTVTVGEDQTGLFIETGTKGTSGGVRTEHKVAAPNGAFIKFGGSMSTGTTKEKSRANE